MKLTQKKTIKDLTIVVVAASILFVQQLALSFIPNVQFSILLVVLYTRVLGFKKTALIVTIHVIAVNLFSPLGPVSPVLMPAMYLAWILIPILLSTVLKKLNSAISLSIFGFIYGFIYGWIFIPFTVWFLDSPFLPYLIWDIPFEIIMAISNMLSILWLYDPLKKALIHQLDQTYHQYNEKSSATS
jgi:hypothetical protein